MSGGFLAVQAKRTKERNKKVNLEDAFKEADTNNDGALTLEEWTEVLSKTGQDNPRLVLLVRVSCNSFAWILFLIAMDDSDWAIHVSYLAARWRMLAHFD